jgi:transcriptional regulator with XRE-family HTH domain
LTKLVIFRQLKQGRKTAGRVKYPRMTETNQESFHQRLKRIRKQRELSVREIAQRIGVPISTYREWENGRLIQGPAPYLLIAKTLNVSLHELFTGAMPGQQGELLGRLDTAVNTLEALRAELLSHF